MQYSIGDRVLVVSARVYGSWTFDPETFKFYEGTIEEWNRDFQSYRIKLDGSDEPWWFHQDTIIPYDDRRKLLLNFIQIIMQEYIKG